jgi:KaiC/GvpD/RAD55 family RecA-like ATPase
MQNNLQLISSGISLIDEGWGGLYKGSNYLLIGGHKSGKTSFGLRFIMEGAAQKERGIYFTSRNREELTDQAEKMNLNHQNLIGSNLITIVRIMPPENEFISTVPDQNLVDYFDDVITMIDEHYPSRIVFDEITSFIRFKDETLLELVLDKFNHNLENHNITSIVTSSEPVTDAMSALLQHLADFSNGLIYLDKEINDLYGTISLLPYIEHKSGELKSNYIFDGERGLKIDLSVLNNLNRKRPVKF